MEGREVNTVFVSHQLFLQESCTFEYFFDVSRADVSECRAHNGKRRQHISPDVVHTHIFLVTRRVAQCFIWVIHRMQLHWLKTWVFKSTALAPQSVLHVIFCRNLLDLSECRFFIFVMYWRRNRRSPASIPAADTPLTDESTCADSRPNGQGHVDCLTPRAPQNSFIRFMFRDTLLESQFSSSNPFSSFYSTSLSKQKSSIIKGMNKIPFITP